MKDLKLYLTEKDFIDKNITDELGKEWLESIFKPFKFRFLEDFIKSRVNYKHITNIYSEDFYLSANCRTLEELEDLIKEYEFDMGKKFEELSKEELLKCLENSSL